MRAPTRLVSDLIMHRLPTGNLLDMFTLSTTVILFLLFTPIIFTFQLAPHAHVGMLTEICWSHYAFPATLEGSWTDLDSCCLGVRKKIVVHNQPTSLRPVPRRILSLPISPINQQILRYLFSTCISWPNCSHRLTRTLLNVGVVLKALSGVPLDRRLLWQDCAP
jgi:hypothetical protein